MRDKRGQVTAFVAIGIIIVVVIALLFLLRGQIMRTAGAKEKITAVSFLDEVEEVRTHIDTCLETSFKESVAYHADRAVEDYEREVADDTLDRFKECMFLDQFRSVDVVAEGSPEIEVEFQQDSKVMYATLYYELKVIRGDQEELLEEFSTSIPLSQKCCVPVEVNGDCISKEEVVHRVCGFLFDIKEGDSLIRGGKCIACA